MKFENRLLALQFPKKQAEEAIFIFFLYARNLSFKILIILIAYLQRF